LGSLMAVRHVNPTVHDKVKLFSSCNFKAPLVQHRGSANEKVGVQHAHLAVLHFAGRHVTFRHKTGDNGKL
jgi:hypothetical protein